MTPLTEAQRRHLRGLAHKLKPFARVGGAGVTEPFLEELDRVLCHHELVKIRLASTGDRDDRDAMLESILARTGAVLVTRIGHVAVLYRPDPAGARLALPAPGRPQA
jgi:RNA-binding protein